MLERALAINPHFQPVLDELAEGTKYVALSGLKDRQIAVDTGAAR